MDLSLFTALAAVKSGQELTQVLSCNDKTEEFGLSLSQEEAGALICAKNDSLIKYQRIEFGASILEKLIDAFCDSSYIEQDEYLEVLSELQDIFYQFKNEASDELTDEELITFMKEQFENICYGDTEYLSGTCLTRFTSAVRAGYKGFRRSGGRGEYENLTQEQRWDKDLYMKVASEMFW